MKDGLDHLQNPQYQYECLGLGGTMMRVGTDGITSSAPGVINTNGWLKHLPYLSYQYWWDEEAHRHSPFDLTGGYGWAKQFLQPGVTLFDDSCFGELISDFEDFKKTPEVAGHAALICNINQMLLDPDDENRITIFPAIPAEWERQGVAFNNLAAKGCVLVSGEFSAKKVRVTLENSSDKVCTRDLRIRLPKGTTALHRPEKGVRVEEGWAVLSAVRLPPKGKVAFTFEPEK